MTDRLLRPHDAANHALRRSHADASRHMAQSGKALAFYASRARRKSAFVRHAVARDAYGRLACVGGFEALRYAGPTEIVDSGHEKLTGLVVTKS